ncbi:MAG: hypothetical protein NTX65_00190 [Ignavibacteriales bacterium]|nr:hypothetical protein [Ignavibacteriales bacterium]
MKFLTLTKVFSLLFILSVIVQLLGSIVLVNSFPNEKRIYDPRFQQLAYNLNTDHSFEIKWGTDKNPDRIMINPFQIQRGIYQNWFPIGYALVIYSAMLIDSNYSKILMILQLLLYSFIPPLIFLLSNSFYFQNNYSRAAFPSLLFLLNPYYSIASIWITDTWMITLITLLCFYLLLCTIKKRLKINIAFGLAVVMLFLLRPIGIFPLVVVYIIYAWKEYRIFKIHLPLIIVLFGILTWGYRNYLLFHQFDFTNSSVGYNLWLGNNFYTNNFLKNHLGDCSTIEDKIIPYFDTKWSFLKNYSEYQKDEFFKQQAWNFIKSHPLETLENSFWKMIGFWSPLRVRTDHWSESTVKTIVMMIYFTPLLFLSFLSVLKFFWKKEYKIKREKGILILFMFLWMIPHLAFFSTSRFRAPIDFGLIILSFDLIIPYFTKNRFPIISDK